MRKNMVNISTIKTNLQWMPVNLPIWVWASIQWWDIEKDCFCTKVTNLLDFRAMTNACPLDCLHCFTNKNQRTLKLDQIKNVIDQAFYIWVRGINYLWEWEPTLDENFWEILDYTIKKWIIPVVFSESSIKLTDPIFVKKLYDSWASIFPKCDSLWDKDYQNWLVWWKKDNYFDKRNEAIEILIKQGFNKVKENWITRMWFDMIVSTKNMNEIEKTLKRCRDKNIFIIFSWFLPSWRSASDNFNQSLIVPLKKRREIVELIQRIDKEMYNFSHNIWNNFWTTWCLENWQIKWNWDFTTCSWRDNVIWNVLETSLTELFEVSHLSNPKMKSLCRDWNCLFREKFIK